MPDEISIRGLVDSDFDLPVREFTGTLAEVSKSPATGYQGFRIEFKFKDLDDIVCIPGAVYNFPTLILNVGESNKHKSRYGYLGDSIARFLSPDQDLKDCIGRRVTMKFCDGLDGRLPPKTIWNRDANIDTYPDKMVPTAVWVVTALEGGVTGEDSAGSIIEHAEEHLIGATRAKFNKWAFADPGVRKNTALQRSISDKSFINSLLKLGRIVEGEDGVFARPS